jgi:protein involved in polysaccharide export with SLBB domain
MRTFLLCFLLLAAGVSHLFAQGAALRPGDTIDIRLSGVPPDEIQQFSATYTIDEQGNLNLPYIGGIRAGGLTQNVVQESVQRKLVSDGIYTHPTITIIVQPSARFVNVGGAVKNPSRIPFTPDLTIMTAINAAGGFNDFADQRKVRWVHEGHVEMVDVRKLRKDPTLDSKIFPGDQIEVEQSIW